MKQPENRQEVYAFYTERVDHFAGKGKILRRKLTRLSIYRLISFLSGVALFFVLFGKHWALGLAGFLAGMVVFAYYVRKHDRCVLEMDDAARLEAMNGYEKEMIDGTAEVWDTGSRYADPEHPFLNDLDIFGRHSLFAYLNRTVTLAGRQILADALKIPLDTTGAIRRRQEGIRELSRMASWRQDFLARGQAYQEQPGEKPEMEAWLAEPPYYSAQKRFLLYRFAMPVLSISLLTIVFTGLVPTGIVLAWLLMLYLMSRMLEYPRINRAYFLIGKRYKILEKAYGLLKMLETAKFKAGELRGLQQQLHQGRERASRSIERLARIVNYFDHRNNMLAGIILNALLAWDLQCVIELEKWKASHRQELLEWFRVVGDMDALISMASFAFNHPGFAFPEVLDEGKLLEAESMAHPLIPDSQRVSNHFMVPEEGRIHIITGPNMAGKSTFLRTLGINLVLGMNGMPVCAERFRFSLCSLYSSMRTSDNLSRNVSYFYAELKRLRQLIDRLESGETVFFLLDEMLKGTNTDDKQEGSKRIIRQLVALGGNGLVATHDLSLTAMEEEFPDRIRNLCFEVEIRGETIEYDYKLREGITARMNALYLMEQMKIGLSGA